MTSFLIVLCIFKDVQVKVTQEQAKKVHRGSTGIRTLSFNLGARWYDGSTPSPGHFTPETGASTHCTEGWLGPTASLEGRGKSRPDRASIPDRQARSATLSRAIQTDKLKF